MSDTHKFVVVDGASQNIGPDPADAFLNKGNRVAAVPRSRQSLRRMLAAASVGAIGLLVATAATAEESAIKAPVVATQPAQNASIRPFSFQASEAALADLKQRVKATRWPDQELVQDDTQGVRLATMQKLADYWANQYDWRRAEASLNKYPQFVTNIDGVDIHFIHVKSKYKNALPVIITHGWPGSIIEQLKIIDPLTNPTAHGGSAADAFDVIIPSIPGYGFSGKPTELGWDPQRVARAWAVLMGPPGLQEICRAGRRLG